MSSVTLVGGGRGSDARVWRRFVADATAHAGGLPRIAVVAVLPRRARAHAKYLTASLRQAGAVEARVVALRHGGSIAPAEFEGVDGVLIGGGLTPAYLRALAPHADRLRALIEDGTPYAGFSAGSMVAGARALIGGYRHAGVQVVPLRTAEDLDELTVADGLGVADLTVDVHTGQWGTLSRLVTAVGAGLLPGGVAIDEATALVLADGDRRVVGAGAAWWVTASDAGVTVRREVAS